MPNPRSPSVTQSLEESYAYVVVPAGRTLVVGDIHGCYREFCGLLESVRFSREDALVSVGDFVDRGPGSVDLLKFFRDTPNAFSVLGNHERRLARVIREGPKRGAWSQLATIETMPPEDREEWADFLESMPAVIQTSHAIVTHARLDPKRPLTAQDPHFTCAVGGADIAIPLSPDGVPWWFLERTWEQPVCLGHVGYERVELVTGRLFALDTGAVRGGRLTLVSFPGARLSGVHVETDNHTAALAAWRREGLGREDRTGWTVQRALRYLNEASGILGVDDPACVLSDALLKPILETTRRLQTAIATRFGEMPPPGPERGAHFQRAKDFSTAPLQRRLLAWLLSDRPLDLTELARTTRSASIAEIATALKALEQKLGNWQGAERPSQLGPFSTL